MYVYAQFEHTLLVLAFIPGTLPGNDRMGMLTFADDLQHMYILMQKVVIRVVPIAMSPIIMIWTNA